MTDKRTVHNVRIPPRTAPFQIDFPESVLDVNGRPCQGSMHLSGGSHFELSPEQLAYVRKTDRKIAALLIEISRSERPITAPPPEFNLDKRADKPKPTKVEAPEPKRPQRKAGEK